MKALFYTDFEKQFIPSIIKEVWIDAIYKSYLEGMKDLTIIDAGANIGLVSQYFIPYAKKIYAVEPTAQHFDCLKKTVDFNKWENIEPIKLAFADKCGKVQMAIQHGNLTMHSLFNYENSDEFEEVEAVTLEKFIEDREIEQVDLLKLDIEGEEFKVLYDDSFKRIVDKIKAIVYETHWFGGKPEELQEYLEGLGYQVFRLPTSADCFLAIRNA